ncbi:putative transporter mch1 [Erysiphe neolycopersici]|uniref:Probable transporter MCH1 n=1 Tax=Erysiphe neolycopersici TaxID=212602 RepID=A0A420HW55_9PEZI|nr:putative transporter mch1 [Erysiphe neolycopersici]
MSDTEASPVLAARSKLLTRSVLSGRNCKLRKANIIRYSSLFSAIFSCLCAGSISTFSLYGHLLQTHLNYTQTQVNIVALAAQVTLCLSVSFVGYLCDRIQPASISASSAIVFGIGYSIAAFTYKNGTNCVINQTGPSDLSIWVMATAFVMIGLATTLMYISAISTCAKNFRKDKHRGLALASPIAAYGLSGFWQSQIGSKVFILRSPDGLKEEMDVFKYFIFLASILIIAGFTGFFLLEIADEDDLIKEAIGQHERSRLLENNNNSLGSQINHSTSVSAFNDLGVNARQRNLSKEEKSQFLNLKTAMFVKDPTMWIFAVGFLLVSGSAAAFITNLGTVIGTLNQSYKESNNLSTTVATQVSIVSLTSTAARLIFGSLTDILAPAPTPNFDHRSAHSILSRKFWLSDFKISRIVFLIGSALILSAGQVFLAAGFVQNHVNRFWLVSMSIGFGDGALYTLSPLIVSIVWGVENFGTNWGIITTSSVLCITFWGLIYSKIYEAGAKATSNNQSTEKEILCYGKACYSATFWSMAVSVWIACALWLWAWKGKQGWAKRKVAV